MAIYFITNGLYRTAGTEKVIVQLAKILDNVIIIVPGSREIAFYGYDSLEVKSVNIGDFPDSGNFNKIKHRIKYFQKLKSKFNFQPNDHIISFSFDLNIVNILLSMNYKCKSIVCEHIEYNYHKGLRNKIRKFYYSQPNVKLICLTKTDQIKYENDGIDVHVIPNFINPVKSDYLGCNRKIISIGRLEYQKNFKFLVQAFAFSKVYEDGWILEIVGEGAEYESIQEEIDINKMNQFIKIHSFTKEIDKYYRESSLLCMTSRFEALPMVLLEAMNFGLPVLVTNFPTGAKEILGYDNQQIVLEYSSEKFGMKLHEMCLNIELRKKLSADNLKLIKDYHPDKVKKLWLSILSNNVSL